MHHELPNGDGRFERVAASELRPVIDDAIVVTKKPAIDEHHELPSAIA